MLDFSRAEHFDMCGVAGYFNNELAPAEAELLLRRMVGAVAHRGPDDQGLFIGKGVGLGHARLSIVGIADGRQPMASGDGNIYISFNGEIFNYVELRQELVTLGCRFHTSSDTEVILHLYNTIGLDFLTRLNGDFAFALWDQRQGRLILARDRMGVRPLFYTQKDGALYFASEVKALLEIPSVQAEIDPFALDQIFTFWAPIPPRTPFKNISQLPPAHVMLVDRSGVTTRPYCRLVFPDHNDAPDEKRSTDLAEELLELLDDSTRIRLRADVPVGAYLSGGLDSSVIASIAARRAPDRLRTFSVTFASSEHDEGSYQMEVVRALGTNHSSINCSEENIAAIFPDMVRHTECPVLRTAPAPMHMLSRFVRDEGFKVVLTGEGADEIFAGYDIFKEAAVRRFCARHPKSSLRPHLFRKLYPYLPGLRKQSAEYLSAFFCSGFDQADPLFSHQPRLRGTAGTKKFFSADLRATLGDYDAAAEVVDHLPGEYFRWHPLHQALYLESSILLPGYILSSQGDRVAMAHGVEGRFPFLDHRLVEFAARLPPGLKLKGLTEKYLLRCATKHLLPPSISKRHKQPYRAPDSQSFKAAGVQNDVYSRLKRSEISKVGLFDVQSVEKLSTKWLQRGLSGFRENSAFIGILSTQLWHEQFVECQRVSGA